MRCHHLMRQVCPTKIGMFPVTRRPEVPLDRQARFEIRTCNDGYSIQLLGFRMGDNRPTLLIDTQQSSIELLIHTGTVLFLQVAAGSSSPTFIAQFRNGNSTLVGTVDGVGGVSYSEEHTDPGDYVIIKVPVKNFPDAPRRFRLKTYD
jgi:hypothetical protein